MILSELIERQAAQRPSGIALRYRDTAVTWVQLDANVKRWAVALSKRGVKKGDAFGIVVRNSPEFIYTFFALARLGARAVPVNFLLKADEISYIFEDAGVVGVITQPSFLANIREAARKVPSLKDIIVAGKPVDGALNFDQLMASDAADGDVPVAASVDDVAMIIYTSGTTGKPKGALLSHKNFIANAQQCIAMVKLTHRDTFLCLLPMFHSFAWTACVLVPITTGATIVIIESVLPFGPVIKQIVRHRVKIFVAVPPIYAALLRVPFWRPLRFINPLRLCISGAAALPSVVHAAFEKKFGIPLLEGYGLTEASPVVSFNPVKKRVTGSVGLPLPGVNVKIVSEQGVTQATGEVGEICVQGDNVMKGYYHQDEATRESFLDPERTWLRTGDLGFLDGDGYIHISDRKKDLIIVKGLNVYPKEIEDVLLSHAAVREAAVIGIPDDTGDELIRAFVTLHEGKTVEKQELSKLCRSRLAPYKCPKEIEIRTELPKNTLGKILKRELRKT